MKKVLSLILALVMCLSLCACGGSDNKVQDQDTVPTPAVDEKEIVIGTWYGEYTSKDDSTEVMQRTLEVYKGGTGHVETYNLKDKQTYSYDGTWEIVDGVLNFSYLGNTTGYEIKSDNGNYTLTQVDRTYIVLEMK